jgi:RHS repeat-associated protein
MTNASGAVVWRAAYNAFGNATVDASSTVVNNLRFPGQYYDAETGLHYNWNRYYDPNTGRYITADPIGLEGGINLFSYVGGNPVNKMDIMGLYPGPCGNEKHQWVPDHPYGVINFSEPCKAHDKCYGCVGKKQGKSKTRCDFEFFMNIQKTCYKYMAVPFLYQHCSSIAGSAYYIAVSVGGSPEFNEARKDKDCCQ